MKIDFVNLRLQHQKYKKIINKNIKKVLTDSNYILGEEVSILEKKLEKFTGAKHAITCSSGTDALLLAILAIDIKPGDEIITTPFTWISNAEMMVLIKAKPVFVDIDPDTFNINSNLIEAAITKKTKAIMPVSLFGQPADMSKIKSIAKKYKLKIIIDGAQSFGSKYKNKTDSNIGDISITSFFPSKPLGCYGDGGAVFTNNDAYARKIKMLRVHGQYKKYHHKYIGIGGRLDTIQAAILLSKLPYFSKELAYRNRVAKFYTDQLQKVLSIPVVKNDRSSSWAQYTIRVDKRDLVKKKLKSKRIPTAIYYPIPLHLQECLKHLNLKKGMFPESEKASNEVLSIPINAFISHEEQKYIVKNIKDIV